MTVDNYLSESAHYREAQFLQPTNYSGELAVLEVCLQTGLSEKFRSIMLLWRALAGLNDFCLRTKTMEVKTIIISFKKTDPK